MRMSAGVYRGEGHQIPGATLRMAMSLQIWGLLGAEVRSSTRAERALTHRVASFSASFITFLKESISDSYRQAFGRISDLFIIVK